MRVIFLMVLCSLFIGCANEQEEPSTDLTSEQEMPIMLDMQGHRGARGLLPENTIPGFLYALELGVTTLEMDVVISSDGQVVLSHEPYFSHEICLKPDGSPISSEEEKSHNLFQLTYEEITQYDCGKKGNVRFPDQQSMAVYKPTLRAVLEASEQYVIESGRPAVHYNIETKSQPERDHIFHPPPDVFTEMVLDVIQRQGVEERTILQSFDVRTLQVAHETAPGLQLALLVGSHTEMDMEAYLEHLGFIPDIYSPNYQLVDRALVEAVHQKGMRIIPWTINTLEKMQELKALQVDGIITDYPDIGMQLMTDTH